MPADVNVIPIKYNLTVIFIQGQFIPSHLKSKMKTTICTSMKKKKNTAHQRSFFSRERKSQWGEVEIGRKCFF